MSALPMPGSPWTGWVGIISLVIIGILIGFDTMTDAKTGEVFHLGLYTIATIPLFAVLLWLGWFKVRNNIAKSEFYS